MYFPLFSVKKRLLIDFSASYTERNFITPMRAMTEYLLRQSDLESLPKVLRRSPYEAEPPITVYYRKDVESKAFEVTKTYLIQKSHKTFSFLFDLMKTKHRSYIFGILLGMGIKRCPRKRVTETGTR